MFDTSVTVVFGVALVVAAIVALVLAAALRPACSPARSSTSPRRPQRIADGDLTARVPEEGPAEVRALAAAYNMMADRLEEQEMMRREFVVNASHELRTPLTNLQGYLEALRDGVLPPEPATFDSLREEVDRLGRLAASLDVLAGARGRATAAVGPSTSAPSSEARPTWPRRRSPGARSRLTRRGRRPARSSSRPARRARPGHGEPAPERGSLHAGGRAACGSRPQRAPTASQVRVSNTGSPIPPDDLPRVWERFYRVEKSRDRARGGAGIGLAIVKRLIEDAGGRVGVTSEGGWTTFRFTLPA